MLLFEFSMTRTRVYMMGMNLGEKRFSGPGPKGQCLTWKITQGVRSLLGSQVLNPVDLETRAAESRAKVTVLGCDG